MKTLYKLTYDEFKKLVKERLQIDSWMVFDDSASSRLDKVQDRHYFVTLKRRAEEKEMKVHVQEIISWLDTLNLLYHTLYNVNEEILNRLTIFQEFQIPFTNKRADYLLVYQNKILILEFSFDKLGSEYKFETKLNQAVNYKELLSNLLPSHIKIGTYTFLINPEVDQNGRYILKHNRYTDADEQANNEKMSDLAAYINLFFSDRDDALMQLAYLDGYEDGVEDSINYAED